MGETERSGKRKRAARWTPSEAREVVERWRGSGQSAAAFAAQHRISASRLSYWSKQLERSCASVSAVARLGSVCRLPAPN